MGNTIKPKYWAEVLEKIDHGKGYWEYLKIGVFTLKDGKPEKVGEYTRNYHSFMNTFCWFTVDGKDYALYSKSYTSTRVMSLPDCKDIGGEEPQSNGFCPTDFYVPSFIEICFKDKSLAGKNYRLHDPDEETQKSGDCAEVVRPLSHENFGFVAGCVWGDDCSWKIEYLDLSEAANGIVKRDNRFGYIELPKGMRLHQAVDPEYCAETQRIVIATASHYDLKTGKRLFPL